MSAAEIRAEIARLLASAKRGASVRRRIEDLEFALSRATATAAINARRAEMGLAPWAGQEVAR